MGVFDALPTDGSEMSAEELAKKLGVDEILLGLCPKKTHMIRANDKKFV